MSKGYWGIALYQPKYEVNWGTVLRSAYNFHVNFIATIDQKYKRQCTDTVNATKNLPVFHYQDMEDFLIHLPKSCQLVRVEIDGEQYLETFTHPKYAIYLFGPENGSLPPIERGLSVSIQTNRCLNLAVTASIVMYDRHQKGT